ncbi:class A beta-lactamase-related serine hydrolase [Kribbella antibiotica]|uniref:Class A beta-lactamase-related serine hydrolase n=1 Tax=Kribbella antibiotica TaxID=190195 RepID=A0A4V2YMU6_9ACTN|nr:serine hydrolase domain-containing protein [Kribbella antibiotica]TDD51617.1 class A beta-lactamase-related serine hydrolase [Kribbella antibiotica]
MDVLRGGIEADREELGVPGVGWAVIENGEITHSGSAGVVEAGKPDEIEAGTLFQAASISKPVAALAMLRLVDRGLLELDEDVNNRLKSWQVPPTRSWQPVVTLRQLASHSAGLSTPGFPGYHPDAPLPTLVEMLAGTTPSNTAGPRVDRIPGTQFAYSGGGTTVIQQLLEDVTGTPFRELMRELVLEPLGMADSDYAQPLPSELAARAAIGHEDTGEVVDGGWHVYPELAAAGLWTTPTDLAKFAIGVHQAYVGAHGALLSPELARQMLTPVIVVEPPISALTHMGIGPFLSASGQLFGHSGGNLGFRCDLIADRMTGYGAAVMTNSTNGSRLALRAFASAASAYGWESYRPEDEMSEVPTAEALAELAGDYRLGERLRLTVLPWGSGLWVTFEGQPPLRFIALSATRLMATSTQAQLELRDGKLVFEQAGFELDCVRE